MSALLYFEKDQIKSVVAEELGLQQDSFNILTLYKRAKGLLINDCILGSKESRYITSCHVYVTGQQLRLAIINYFLEIVILRDGNSRTMWMANVSYYDQHNCRVWYGSSVEVWAAVTSQGVYFVPISKVKCRVAYSKQEVNFGSVIGTDKIIIACPLNN